ncbi:MAG: HlyD family secretion protein, partial [Mangrovicoccus sp.]|nr:HlyD family secretion protein [Mangrovicoccus sp.]
AAVETARRKIEEVEAEAKVALSQLAEAEGKVTQARGLLQQALDEYNTRAELLKRGETAVSRREVERAQVTVNTQQGMLNAALAARDAVQATIDFDLPARKASAEAELHEADVALSKTTIYAGVGGRVEQFTLRPGDMVNQMMRPAGILVPDKAGRTGLQAGFGQIESQVLRPGMIGEVTCPAIPFTIIPVVITEVQSVVAGGQVRPTDALLDPQNARPGTLLAYMEPLFPGGLDRLPPGSNCIANAYTSNYDALHSGNVTGLHALALHAVDAVGLVHAMILRLQALLLPVQTLVLGGGH